MLSFVYHAVLVSPDSVTSARFVVCRKDPVVARRGVPVVGVPNHRPAPTACVNNERTGPAKEEVSKSCGNRWWLQLHLLFYYNYIMLHIHTHTIPIHTGTTERRTM
jgi:hypothetical protein